MNIRLRPSSGFTLVEIMIVIAIIGLLMGVAIPNIYNAQKKAKKQVCLMNIEAIDGAKQQWVTENKKSDKDTPTEDDLKGYLKDNRFPSCPSGGSYTVNPVDSKATCSIHAETPQ